MPCLAVERSLSDHCWGYHPSLSGVCLLCWRLAELPAPSGPVGLPASSGACGIGRTLTSRRPSQRKVLVMLWWGGGGDLAFRALSAVRDMGWTGFTGSTSEDAPVTYRLAIPEGIMPSEGCQLPEPSSDHTSNSAAGTQRLVIPESVRQDLCALLLG